jgi:hypothetical protein
MPILVAGLDSSHPVQHDPTLAAYDDQPRVHESAASSAILTLPPFAVQRCTSVLVCPTPSR